MLVKQDTNEHLPEEFLNYLTSSQELEDISLPIGDSIDVDYIARDVEEEHLRIIRITGWDILDQIQKTYPKSGADLSKLLDTISPALVFHSIRHEKRSVFSLLPLPHVVTQRDMNVKALYKWYMNSCGYDSRLANAFLIAEWEDSEGKTVQEVIDGQHRLGLALVRALHATGGNYNEALEELKEHYVSVAILPFETEAEANECFERLQMNRIEPKTAERGINAAYRKKCFSTFTASWMAKMKIADRVGKRRMVGCVDETVMYLFPMKPATECLLYSSVMEKRAEGVSKAVALDSIEQDMNSIYQEYKDDNPLEYVFEYFDTSLVEVAFDLITEVYERALSELTSVNNEKQARSALKLGRVDSPTPVKIAKFTVATFMALIEDNPEIRDISSTHRKVIVSVLTEILKKEKQLSPAAIGSGNSANQRTVVGCAYLISESHKHIDINKYPQVVKRAAKNGGFIKVAPEGQELSKKRSAYFQNSSEE